MGCGVLRSPQKLCSGCTWVDVVQPDSNSLLRRVDIWCLSSDGAIAAAGFHEFKSRGHAMPVLAWLGFIGSGSLVVCNK